MRETRSVVWGLALVVVGSLVLAARLAGVHVPLVSLWPVLLLVLGVGHLAGGRPGSATAWTLYGVVCLACSLGWCGLSFERAWPLLVVAAGLGMVVRALEHRPPGAREATPQDGDPHFLSRGRARRAGPGAGPGAWFAAFALIATGFLWLGALGVLSVVTAQARAWPALIAVGTLARSALAVTLHLWWMLPLLVASGMILALAAGRSVSARRGIGND